MINPPDKSESQNQANENPVDSKFTRDALALFLIAYLGVMPESWRG
jgi:hypothetical protein